MARRNDPKADRTEPEAKSGDETCSRECGIRSESSREWPRRLKVEELLQLTLEEMQEELNRQSCSICIFGSVPRS